MRASRRGAARATAPHEKRSVRSPRPAMEALRCAIRPSHATTCPMRDAGTGRVQNRCAVVESGRTDIAECRRCWVPMRPPLPET